jgi:hypothetical protein
VTAVVRGFYASVKDLGRSQFPQLQSR